MSNRMNRYKASYERLVRPNNASTYPIHVFKRSANHRSNENDRIGNRESCFDATFIHLTERFEGKEVFLIGTMNQSSILG